ncbi:hypothetical protein SLEP1_g53496, partial [Rubroshorea leprosula]
VASDNPSVLFDCPLVVGMVMVLVAAELVVEATGVGGDGGGVVERKNRVKCSLRDKL